MRVINRKELSNELKPYFEIKTKDELMKPFLELNIPVGVVKNINDVFEEKAAKKLILTEKIEGLNTKRVKTAIFNISD